MELQHVMTVMERLETKVDDIRDTIHDIDLKTEGTMIKQVAQEDKIRALEKQVSELKSSHDKAAGAWKLLTLPGVISFLYAASQMIKS